MIAAAAISAFDRLYPASGAGARVGVLMDLMSGKRVAGLGSAVGMPTIDLQKTSERSVADLACALGTRIAELRASNAARDSASLFALSGPLLRFLAGRTPVRMGSLAVTNLGNLDLAEHTRLSGLFETFGIVTNHRIYFDIALQAQSLDGRMTVVFTSPLIDTTALEEFGRTWRSVLGVGG